MSGDDSKVTGPHRVPFKKRTSVTSRRLVAVTDAMIEAERAKLQRAITTSRRLRAVSPEIADVDESVPIEELLGEDAPEWVAGLDHIEGEEEGDRNYLLAGSELHPERRDRIRGNRRRALSQVSATSGWVGRWIGKLNPRGKGDGDEDR